MVDNHSFVRYSASTTPTRGRLRLSEMRFSDFPRFLYSFSIAPNNHPPPGDHLGRVASTTWRSPQCNYRPFLMCDLSIATSPFRYKYVRVLGFCIDQVLCLRWYQAAYPDDSTLTVVHEGLEFLSKN